MEYREYLRETSNPPKLGLYCLYLMVALIGSSLGIYYLAMGAAGKRESELEQLQHLAQDWGKT